MKYLKKFLLIIISLLFIILLILFLDYVRLNLTYLFQNDTYVESIPVQGNKNKYTPQGLTYSDKYNVVLQTSYHSKHEVSKLYVTEFSTEKFLKELKIKEIDDKDNIGHVGGITTDNNHVWITSDYEINEYSLEEILNTKKDSITSIKNTKLPIRGDFCTYHNNILWIGDFFLKPFYNVPDDTPLLFGYKIKEELDYSTPDYIISLPKMVQGIAITSDNHFVVTRSFTNLIQSDLSIYENVLEEEANYYTLNNKKIPYYHFTNRNKIKSIKLPPMAEEFFYKDNKLYILFENSSDTYFYAYPKMNKVIEYEIDEN